MNKEQFTSLLRELLTAIGAALMTWGKIKQSTWEPILGLAMAMGALGWAVVANEGKEMMLTLFRKVISAASGVVIVTGVLTPEKADALVGVIGTVVAIAWGSWSKAATPPDVSGGLKLLLLVGAVLCLNACMGLQVTPDGCVMGSYSKGAQTWKAGVCMGEDGKVNRVRVQWDSKQADDSVVTVRATVFEKLKKSQLEYLSGGIWLKWDAKSGVTLGPLPPGVDVKQEGSVIEIKPGQVTPGGIGVEGEVVPAALAPVVVAAK